MRHTESSRNRLPLLDSLRGAALLCMAVFHFRFDLRALGWLAPQPSFFWQVFRNLTLATFLLLVGAGFVLGSASYRSPNFRGRLGRVLLGALFLSAVTFFLFGKTWVYFGVLHFIFCASLCGPSLQRRPWLCLLLAPFFLLLPLAFALPPSRLATLLGLSSAASDSLDLVPVAPWFGSVLLGVWTGSFLPRLSLPCLQWEWRPLTWLGRHSLIFYLTHQAVVFPLAWTVAYFW